jgi:hypothetical protein
MKARIPDVFRHGFGVLEGAQVPDTTDGVRSIMLPGDDAKSAISGFANAIGISNWIQSVDGRTMVFQPKSSTYTIDKLPCSLELVSKQGSVTLFADGAVEIESDTVDLTVVLPPIIYDYLGEREITYS